MLEKVLRAKLVQVLGLEGVKDWQWKKVYTIETKRTFWGPFIRCSRAADDIKIRRPTTKLNVFGCKQP